MRVLLEIWRGYVQGTGKWSGHRYEGYLPVVVDITAFWRPTLKKCPSKHYHPTARRALPTVIYGIIGEVGEIEGQRMALPRGFVSGTSETAKRSKVMDNHLQNGQKRSGRG